MGCSNAVLAGSVGVLAAVPAPEVACAQAANDPPDIRAAINQIDKFD
ncbi:hypothetical protein GCM10027341_47970 [Spirosoma knui]